MSTEIALAVTCVRAEFDCLLAATGYQVLTEAHQTASESVHHGWPSLTISKSLCAKPGHPVHSVTACQV